MKNKALLLDRDGVINEERGYVGFKKDFFFAEGVFSVLRRASDLGYRLVILTNQSGVARGYYTEDDYLALTEHMLETLQRESISIDLVQHCFEAEDSQMPRYRRQSFWRKPQPGMILEAAKKLDLDLSKSVMIGDKVSDVQASLAAGVGTSLWLRGTYDLAGTHIIHSLTEIVPFLEG